jgi:hypothetical protein
MHVHLYSLLHTTHGPLLCVVCSSFLAICSWLCVPILIILYCALLLLLLLPLLLLLLCHCRVKSTRVLTQMGRSRAAHA